MTTKLKMFTYDEVEKHKLMNSCWVLKGKYVYDITDFLDDHPGGAELILEYGGKDITEIMADEESHVHSDAAYEMLEEYLIGTVTSDAAEAALHDAAEDEPIYKNTGMSTAEDLNKETDLEADFKKHHFLDLNRPLIPQMWTGGFSKAFYLDQVHRPRHYKGGASAPLFGNFLEPLTKTAWWVIPLVWLPAITCGVLIGMGGMPNKLVGAAYFSLGYSLWSLIEYSMHRFLFHIDDYLPDNRVFLMLHFLMHGIHHYLPMDRYRLVMPPTLFIILAAPFYRFAHFVLFYNWHAAVLAYCGGVLGYVVYDLTHYFLHHKQLPKNYQELKKWHLAHHFADYQNGFGVTTPFWDKVFGTELRLQSYPPKPKTQ
ncbi:Inositolphosphorylceramide-B hydroxylase [Ascosphaera apis ARSEF 7405]|uniref:Ceramide very long chain fatty acid hydroxylase n=1 Tax=Ascosphaera apis ARSEF 7405 TaxID=392613 RepID=A0A168AMW7_9EURO|nr:Inositolphosphorylceramide-B hydroxylase [Ascosphaera apis ARSEF 7405]